MENSIWYSRTLVFSQMMLIALILSPVRSLGSGPLPLLVIAVPLMGLAVALALWAFICMRIENFSVMPEPSASAQLISSGPYRWIRHPMYSAVLMGSIGACIAHANTAKWFYLAVLLAVLLLKIRKEERLLGTRFTQYAKYRSRTGALVPRFLRIQG